MGASLRAAEDRDVERCVFRQEGDRWTIRYEGPPFSLPAIKGLQYISRVLRDPGAKIPAIELCAPQRPAGEPSRGDVERARQRLVKAIKCAIGHIADHDPALGYHLTTAIRTGFFCSYDPDPTRPVSWRG